MLRQSVEFALTAVVRVNHGVAVTIKSSRGVHQRRVYKVTGAASSNGPAHNLARIHIKHTTAVELAFAGGVFGDIREPHFIGSRRREVALQEILAGGHIFEVRIALAGTGNPLDIQAIHDFSNQLRVHDEAVLDLESGPNAQHSVGGARTFVNVLHETLETELAQVAVARQSILDVLIGRARQIHDGAGVAFRETQAVKTSHNLVFPFGSAPPFEKSSLASRVAANSVSSSLIRRRASASSSITPVCKPGR